MMENNEKILRKLYQAGTRKIRPDELRPLKFDINGLYTSQSVAFGIITYYFWKDVKYGEYLLDKVEETGQTENDNPTYFIKKIEKDDNRPEEKDMNILKDFLFNSEENSYATCKRYLQNNPGTLLNGSKQTRQRGVTVWVSGSHGLSLVLTK